MSRGLGDVYKRQAHNLLSALIDNHIYWGNKLKIDDKRIVWKRVMDMNDRALRFININTKGVAKEFPREDGFDITVASEVMAIFCLSNDLKDLEKRIGNITIAYQYRWQTYLCKRSKCPRTNDCSFKRCNKTERNTDFRK